jgi:NADP-dependent 3-hydroxy acid dehydrogenase YdfG
MASRHPRTALARPLDVTDPHQRESGVRTAEEHFGGVDLPHVYQLMAGRVPEADVSLAEAGQWLREKLVA